MVDVQKKIEARIEELRKEFSELSLALKVCQRFARADGDTQKGAAQTDDESSSSRPFLKNLSERPMEPEAVRVAA
ncbi:MAG: hypothetical protein ABSB33_02910 [Tepidisphaeraceae bacterium]|jgi:hypothetical protein